MIDINKVERTADKTMRLARNAAATGMNVIGVYVDSNKSYGTVQVHEIDDFADLSQGAPVRASANRGGTSIWVHLHVRPEPDVEVTWCDWITDHFPSGWVAKLLEPPEYKNLVKEIGTLVVDEVNSYQKTQPQLSSARKQLDQLVAKIKQFAAAEEANG